MAKHFDVAPLAGCHPEIGLLGDALRDGTVEWREELGDATEDEIVWQPRPGGHSLGGVLLHIGEVEIFWLHQIVAGQTPDPDEMQLLMSEQIMQYEGSWPVPHRKPLGWYYERLDSIRERTLALLPTFQEPDRRIYREKWDSDFTVRWILSHVVGHESYHGGQAVLLKELAKHAMGR